MIRRLAAGLTMLSLAFATPVSACPLALVLALDVSSSVDDGEHRLQSEGLARALTDPAVMESILSQGGIWLAAFEWSGRRNQRILIDWTHLNSLRVIGQAAARLRDAPRSTNEFPTALGYALGFASVYLKKSPPGCLRRVIDVAGDGVNNEGFAPSNAYNAFDFRDVTVNGLVIKGAEPDPETFYREQVQYGPGSFIEIAHGYEDYAEAMRRKLIREVLGASLAEAPSDTSRRATKISSE